MAQITSVLFGITVGLFPSPRPDSDDHNWYHFSSRLSLFWGGTALGSAGFLRPGHPRTLVFLSLRKTLGPKIQDIPRSHLQKASYMGRF